MKGFKKFSSYENKSVGYQWKLSNHQNFLYPLIRHTCTLGFIKITTLRTLFYLNYYSRILNNQISPPTMHSTV